LDEIVAHADSRQDRGDRPTVRELARLQGFTDDFIFYQPTLNEQYWAVLTAIPPAVVQKCARAIRAVVEAARTRRISDLSIDTRPIKKIRSELSSNPLPSDASDVDCVSFEPPPTTNERL
jgi:hypothetical protein